MNNFNNKNWLSDDFLKPTKNKTYYYDFGTGKKVEKEEVKKTRDAFLEGFDFPETVIEREKEERSNPFVFNEPEYTHFPLASSENLKFRISRTIQLVHRLPLNTQMKNQKNRGIHISAATLCLIAIKKHFSTDLLRRMKAL